MFYPGTATACARMIEAHDRKCVIGQALFASRFFVQLLKSEMEGRSVVPVAFWYFSIGGGFITLIYAYHLGPVGLPFLIAQSSIPTRMGAGVSGIGMRVTSRSTVARLAGIWR